jgi:transcription antitermination factor NusG
MSKAYRFMHEGPIRKRQLMPARTPRPMREVDRTNESPLLAPPIAETWRVVMTEPRREREAVVELVRAGYAAWYPQETVIRERRDHREKAKINQPLFPRYVFVALRPVAEKAIRDCRHVSGLLPYRPTVKTIENLYLRQEGREFDAIRAAEAAAEAERKALIGKSVTITEGPFAEFNGIVLKAEHERVEILVSIFGRLSPAIVDRRSIAA